jgi:hypothetical protein
MTLRVSPLERLRTYANRRRVGNLKRSFRLLGNPPTELLALQRWLTNDK